VPPACGKDLSLLQIQRTLGCDEKMEHARRQRNRALCRSLAPLQKPPPLCRGVENVILIAAKPVAKTPVASTAAFRRWGQAGGEAQKETQTNTRGDGAAKARHEVGRQTGNLVKKSRKTQRQQSTVMLPMNLKPPRPPDRRKKQTPWGHMLTAAVEPFAVP